MADDGLEMADMFQPEHLPTDTNAAHRRHGPEGLPLPAPPNRRHATVNGDSALPSGRHWQMLGLALAAASGTR